MITAINIKTERWNKIIMLLLAEGWTVRYKYDNIDAGIDFDFLILEKENEEILFGWDNWCEGEIQCSEDRMRSLEQLAKYSFTIGEPENLKPAIILMYRPQKG